MDSGIYIGLFCAGLVEIVDAVLEMVILFGLVTIGFCSLVGLHGSGDVCHICLFYIIPAITDGGPF